jgi:hypothetical protein
LEERKQFKVDPKFHAWILSQRKFTDKKLKKLETIPETLERLCRWPGRKK